MWCFLLVSLVKVHPWYSAASLRSTQLSNHATNIPPKSLPESKESDIYAQVVPVIFVVGLLKIWHEFSVPRKINGVYFYTTSECTIGRNVKLRSNLKYQHNPTKDPAADYFEGWEDSLNLYSQQNLKKISYKIYLKSYNSCTHSSSIKSHVIPVSSHPR